MQPPANHGHDIAAAAPSGPRNAAADPPHRFQARSMQRTESNMHALINVFNCPADSIGRVISCHRTEKAAEAARYRHGRAVRRANGSTSYVPTRIVELARRVSADQALVLADIVPAGCDHV